MAGELANDHPTHLRTRRFGILRIHAIVADHRRSHDYDLPEVARIGKRFLVAGEVGGEHHLTEGWIDGANGGAGKPVPVFEQDESGKWLPHCFGLAGGVLAGAGAVLAGAVPAAGALPEGAGSVGAAAPGAGVPGWVGVPSGSGAG